MRELCWVLVLCLAGFIYTHPQLWQKRVQSFAVAAGISRANAFDGTSVEMYAMTTCGTCKIMASQMKQAGIPFTEYYFDTDMKRKIELSKRLKNADIDTGGVLSAPTIFIGDHIFQGMTPMTTIKAARKS